MLLDIADLVSGGSGCVTYSKNGAIVGVFRFGQVT